MKRLSEILPWEVLSKKAFWDRDVSLEVWRRRAKEGHPSYLPGAVAVFDPVEFIHYYDRPSADGNRRDRLCPGPAPRPSSGGHRG